MKKVIFFLAIISFARIMAFSQTLQEILRNPDLNYFQILEQIENDKSVLDSADEKTQKRFDRWRAFWVSRIDEKGNFTTYGNLIQQYCQDDFSRKSSNNIWESLGPKANMLWGNPSSFKFTT